ncbi:hypothetical protein Purlil1_12322 [Purpureocillium lilacinum]|uniref:Uncharacterized protein n=1 Tax=Purpureocillium lilacinum TaxID=33203 RepID=A0ABR0BH57_PURLI|nr:hypothetical protein Purlil1_12322 [Purpureocillium lilacinum]
MAALPIALHLIARDVCIEHHESRGGRMDSASHVASTPLGQQLPVSQHVPRGLVPSQHPVPFQVPSMETTAKTHWEPRGVQQAGIEYALTRFYRVRQWGWSKFPHSDGAALGHIRTSAVILESSSGEARRGHSLGRPTPVVATRECDQIFDTGKSSIRGCASNHRVNEHMTAQDTKMPKQSPRCHTAIALAPHDKEKKRRQKPNPVLLARPRKAELSRSNPEAAFLPPACGGSISLTCTSGTGRSATSEDAANLEMPPAETPQSIRDASICGRQEDPATAMAIVFCPHKCTNGSLGEPHRAQFGRPSPCLVVRNRPVDWKLRITDLHIRKWTKPNINEDAANVRDASCRKPRIHGCAWGACNDVDNAQNLEWHFRPSPSPGGGLPFVARLPACIRRSLGIKNRMTRRHKGLLFSTACGRTGHAASITKRLRLCLIFVQGTGQHGVASGTSGVVVVKRTIRCAKSHNPAAAQVPLSTSLCSARVRMLFRYWAQVRSCPLAPIPGSSSDLFRFAPGGWRGEFGHSGYPVVAKADPWMSGQFQTTRDYSDWSGRTK